VLSSDEELIAEEELVIGDELGAEEKLVAGKSSRLSSLEACFGG